MMLLTAGAVSADEYQTLRLMTGEVIRGKITSQGPSYYRVRTESGSVELIFFSEISSVDASSAPEMYLPPRGAREVLPMEMMSKELYFHLFTGEVVRGLIEFTGPSHYTVAARDGVTRRFFFSDIAEIFEVPNDDTFIESEPVPLQIDEVDIFEVEQPEVPEEVALPEAVPEEVLETEISAEPSEPEEEKQVEIEEVEISEVKPREAPVEIKLFDGFPEEVEKVEEVMETEILPEAKEEKKVQVPQRAIALKPAPLAATKALTIEILSPEKAEQTFKQICTEIHTAATSTIRSRRPVGEWMTQLKTIVYLNPESIWADDAQFLIAALAFDEPQKQAEEFEYLIKYFPDSQIEPWTSETIPELMPSERKIDLRIRIALISAYRELGQEIRAREIHDESIAKYPKATTHIAKFYNQAA
jgi:hypothetical protein